MTSCCNDASSIEEKTQQLTSNIQEEINHQNQQKADPQLTLIMERFTWTHTLDYKVEIQPDRKVNFTKYDGRFLTSKITKNAESNLEKEKIAQLITEIETSDFFSLDSEYGYKEKNCPVKISDNDSVKIFIKLNGREKKINHNLGCSTLTSEDRKKGVDWKDRIFPQQLYKLENRIDEIIETKRWIGTGKY